VYRPVTYTPKFRKIEPTVVPCLKSAGKLRLPAKASVCGRLLEVVRIACGGGELPPPSWLTMRLPKPR